MARSILQPVDITVDLEPKFYDIYGTERLREMARQWVDVCEYGDYSLAEKNDFLKNFWCGIWKDYRKQIHEQLEYFARLEYEEESYSLREMGYFVGPEHINEVRDKIAPFFYKLFENYIDNLLSTPKEEARDIIERARRVHVSPAVERAQEEKTTLTEEQIVFITEGVNKLTKNEDDRNYLKERLIEIYEYGRLTVTNHKLIEKTLNNGEVTDILFGIYNKYKMPQNPLIHTLYLHVQLLFDQFAGKNSNFSKNFKALTQ